MKRFQFQEHLLILLVFLLSISCRKADRDSDTTTAMVSDNSHATFLFNDLFLQAHQFALSDSFLNSTGSFFILDTNCIKSVNHTNFPGFFPDTVTLNFGTNNGQACLDGHVIRGKLKLVFTEKYGAASKSLTVIPENYFLNDYRIEGKMIINCKGRNSSNNLFFILEISNGAAYNDEIRLQFFAPANGQTAAFQREWISGESTDTIFDDVFMLSGTYGGIASQGTNYKSEIISPLKYQIDCKWISAGKETITPLNLSPRNVDYGSGCDNKAVTTINKKDFEVSLLP